MRGVTWGVAVLILTAVTGCGGNARTLKDIIVKQLNIPVETVEIIDDSTATGTLAGGEKLAIRWKRTGNEIRCICQKPKAQAETEVRSLVSQLGFTAKSVDIRPSAAGVGYEGEVTADNGVSFDVIDNTDLINFLSMIYVKVAPRSYPQYARVTLEKELNAKTTEDAAIRPGDLPPLNGDPVGGPIFLQNQKEKKSLFQGRFKASGKWYAVELYLESGPPGPIVPGPGRPAGMDTSSKLNIVYQELR